MMFVINFLHLLEFVSNVLRGYSHLVRNIVFGVNLVRLWKVQVLAATNHLLCWPLCQEETIFQKFCQHCFLWHSRHLHCICSHCICAVWILQAAQHPHLTSKDRPCHSYLNTDSFSSRAGHVIAYTKTIHTVITLSNWKCKLTTSLQFFLHVEIPAHLTLVQYHLRSSKNYTLAEFSIWVFEILRWIRLEN